MLCWNTISTLWPTFSKWRILVNWINGTLIRLGNWIISLEYLSCKCIFFQLILNFRPRNPSYVKSVGSSNFKVYEIGHLFNRRKGRWTQSSLLCKTTTMWNWKLIDVLTMILTSHAITKIAKIVIGMLDKITRLMYSASQPTSNVTDGVGFILCKSQSGGFWPSRFAAFVLALWLSDEYTTSPDS